MNISSFLLPDNVQIAISFLNLLLWLCMAWLQPVRLTCYVWSSVKLCVWYLVAGWSKHRSFNVWIRWHNQVSGSELWCGLITIDMINLILLLFFSLFLIVCLLKLKISFCSLKLIVPSLCCKENEKLFLWRHLIKLGLSWLLC